ncbi:MAG: TolC family protein [Opitutus sp.]|nr:TolC family protein [Opitutus sp.]MCS6248064.1 TolC family protein [Opitutus sp.]MCS6275210.1 TolC family protein [Opitutus sp.]MCS6278201.1 TolC family protein [Opitutus sp.]MCS6299311.1 TolC family protein [Opitutus sp.]
MKSSSFLALLAPAALLIGGTAQLDAQPAAAPVETVSPAPDVPPRLDLRNAIAYALENNYSIQQARERIKEQEGLIVEVKAKTIPQLGLGSSYKKKDQELVQGGGSDQDWSIALEARQVLYAGGGISAALEAQKVSREAALLDLKATINNALLEVRTRYYDVLLAREQITVQEQNVQLLRQQLQNAKNRFEAGTISNFEVLRAEVELANAQPEFIKARNRKRTSVDQLRQAIGYTNTTPENLHKTPEFLGTLDFQPVSYDLQKSLDAARTNRPDLLRLDRLAKAREAGVRIEQAGNRPTVDLIGGYQVVKKISSNSFNDSPEGWVVGVQSNWAIFDGRATAGKVAQARSRLRQSQLSAREQELAVEVQVRTALSSLQEAAELAEAAQKVVAQAEESLRLADARYAAGSATQLDVLQARVSLTQSRTNQLAANYSYNVALATVRRALGEPDAYAPEAAQ